MRKNDLRELCEVFPAYRKAACVSERILMISVLILGALAACEQGCGGDQPNVAHRRMFEEILAKPDVIERVRIAEKELPTDKWSDRSKIGHTNDSLFERECGLAHELLEQMRPRLEKMSASELLNELVGSESQGVRYYVYRDGNAMIIEQLKTLPKPELKALQNLKIEDRGIFTGSGGRSLSMKQLIEELNQGK